MKSLEDTSFAELAKAKIDGHVAAVEGWLSDEDNAKKAVWAATGGFTVLAAGMETAAHLLGKREGTKAAVGRAGLHLAAGVAAAGAGLGLNLEGYNAGIIANKNR